MWYPTLPVLLQLHDRICAAQGKLAKIDDMSAIDEAILAPQRMSEEKRTEETIARKCAFLIEPLIEREPFQNCGDRVAYSIAQRFVDRNGYVLRVPVKEAIPAFEAMRAGEIAVDELGTWIESNLSSRFDTAHKKRIFSALNSLAEVREDLQRVAGFDHHAEKVDVVGYVISQQMATLFRLDEEERRGLKGRFPSFWAAWEEALTIDGA